MTGAATRIVVRRTGGPEVLEVDAFEPGDLAPGSVRIDVGAAGVNYLDVHHRDGQYDRPTPFTPGMEAAGIVAAVGPDADGVAVGDRVAFAMAPGAYASVVDVPAARVVPLPAGVDVATGAAVMLQGLTAHYLTEAGRPLAGGDTVLVHAGAGGVGHLLVQVATLRGARVLATASTPQKRAFAETLGAAAAFDSAGPIADAVAEATGGDGVDIVYDGVGKATFDVGLQVLRPRGALVLYGQASGAVPPVDTGRLAARSLMLTRTSLPHFIATREELRRRAEELLDWVDDGHVRVRVDARFPLEDAPAAHAHLESRRARGKILLVPGERPDVAAG